MPRALSASFLFRANSPDRLRSPKGACCDAAAMATFSQVKLRHLPQYFRATFAPYGSRDMRRRAGRNSLAHTSLTGSPEGPFRRGRNNVLDTWREFSAQYSARYFQKGSARPLFHIILASFALGYTLEYSHLST